jgi:hypothetical protein
VAGKAGVGVGRRTWDGWLVRLQHARLLLLVLLVLLVLPSGECLRVHAGHALLVAARSCIQ